MVTPVQRSQIKNISTKCSFIGHFIKDPKFAIITRMSLTAFSSQDFRAFSIGPCVRVADRDREEFEETASSLRFSA
jgi:hypothetical protein